MSPIATLSFYSVLWFIAGGYSFFTGIVLLITASIIHLRVHHKVLLCGIYFLYIVAILSIVLSATPFPCTIYIVWLTIFISWLIARNLQKKYSFSVLCALTGINIGLILIEAPHRFAQPISIDNIQQTYVIGDSISAGMGTKDERTWPVLLSEKLDIPVINLSVAGATAGSALKRQVPKVAGENNLVFLELGGNDYLNYNSPQEFEENIVEIIHRLRKSSNNVVWFELPLLPQYYQYGRIQRKLANRLELQLIPRTVLATVFSSNGTTSDGIHLTQKGHEMMSEKIKEIIRQ